MRYLFVLLLVVFMGLWNMGQAVDELGSTRELDISELAEIESILREVKSKGVKSKGVKSKGVKSKGVKSKGVKSKGVRKRGTEGASLVKRNVVSSKESLIIYKYARFEGNRYFDLKDYVSAKFFYEIAVSNASKKGLDSFILYRLGFIFLESGEFGEAISYFKLVPIFASGGVRGVSGDLALKTYSGLGRAFAGKKDYAKAIVYFKKALSVDSGDISSIVSLSGVYLVLQDYISSKRLLLPALRVNPNNFLLLFSTGNHFYKKGDREQALLYYRRALGRGSGDIGALYRLGFIYSAKKDWVKALNYFERAYKADRDNLFILEAFAHTLIMRGTYQRAISLINRHNKRNEALEFLLAFAYYKSGVYSSALSIFEDLVRLGRRDTGILSFIAFSSFQLKDYYGAIFYYRWALKRLPSSIELRKKLALTYFKASLFYMSSLEFLKLIELGERGADIFFHLGESYLGNKEYVKADKVFRHMLLAFGDYDRINDVKAYLERIRLSEKTDLTRSKVD